MISFFATFTAYLVLYKYTALFLIVLSGFILPVPVNEIILVAGAFASQGYMSVLAVMAIALFTNIGVDILGYSLTYRFGDDILRILRIRKDATFYRVRKYLENYASGTIYFGAIVGPFRPLINFISGLMRLPFR
ncbi:hypothetical protein KGQ74_00005, partial [Patescibacteria group bacterium]|nr:hypothetical protein [Patescibacteria group bacterium]